MGIEERVLNLEKFASDVREHTRILTEIMGRYDERLDEHNGMFREADRSIAALADAQIRTEAAGANTEAHIVALTDAQVRTEAAQAEFRAAQAESERKLGALVDAHIRTEETVRALGVRIDSLTSVVERLANVRRDGQ